MPGRATSGAAGPLSHDVATDWQTDPASEARRAYLRLADALDGAYEEVQRQGAGLFGFVKVALGQPLARAEAARGDARAVFRDSRPYVDLGVSTFESKSFEGLLFADSFPTDAGEIDRFRRLARRISETVAERTK